MYYNYSRVSSEKNFYSKTNPFELLEKFGSPLYVYNEDLLRKRCCDLKGLISYSNFTVNYSAKANSNLEILKIVRRIRNICFISGIKKDNGFIF